jgi:phosphatidylglycerophosphate synthase
MAQESRSDDHRDLDHGAHSDLQRIMKPVQRIQQNMLAASERRLLTWLCARLPLWVTPDRLTLLGFAGALLVAAGYVLSAWSALWLWFSIAGYCVNWFGDSLDGSLARFRNIERPDFGYFLDHSTDSLANMIVVVGLGLSPYVRLDVALFGLAGYLLLSIHTFLAARVVDEFRLSYLAGGPTELRLVLIAMTLAMFAIGPMPAGSTGLSVFDVFVAGFGCVLVLLFIKQTFVTARRLYSKRS